MQQIANNDLLELCNQAISLTRTEKNFSIDQVLSVNETDAQFVISIFPNKNDPRDLKFISGPILSLITGSLCYAGLTVLEQAGRAEGLVKEYVSNSLDAAQKHLYFVLEYTSKFYAPTRLNTPLLVNFEIKCSKANAAQIIIQYATLGENSEVTAESIGFVKRVSEAKMNAVSEKAMSE